MRIRGHQVHARINETATSPASAWTTLGAMRFVPEVMAMPFESRASSWPAADDGAGRAAIDGDGAAFRIGREDGARAGTSSRDTTCMVDIFDPAAPVTFATSSAVHTSREMGFPVSGLTFPVPQLSHHTPPST
jgi:hypothetical protein